MHVEFGSLEGVLLFVPTPHRDDRGLFTRTFDATVASEAGLDPYSFIQDSQSRSRFGTIRGMHGRSGQGEGKLVRCAQGAVLDVVIDARPASRTFGRSMSVTLDDTTFVHLYVPPGFLHGFQAISDQADVCYRIDRLHDPSEDIAVRWDDPDLAIDWPVPVTSMSLRDRQADSWADVVEHLSVKQIP